MPRPLQRLPHWSLRLAEYLAQRRRLPFAWGSHDCCQYVRRGLQAMCGRDPARGWGLRRYTTALGAQRQLDRLGGVEALPARAGLAEIPLRLAQRGDVVVGVDPVGRIALGFATGTQAAFADPAGLLFMPLLNCRKAWRVG